MGYPLRPGDVWSDEKEMQMKLRAILKPCCSEDEGTDLFRKLSTVGRRDGQEFCVLFGMEQVS